MNRLPPLMLVFLVAVIPCRADITIGDPPTFNVNIQIFAPTGQSFIADSPALKSIGMWTSTCNCPNDPPMQFQLSLLNGAGTSGAPVATRTATAPIGLYGFLDFDFNGVTLVVGQTYTAVMTQITPNPPTSAGTGIYGVQDVYPGGMAFISGQPRPDLDLSLRVLDAAPPLPALQYAAKFVCGQPNKVQAEHGEGMVAYGTYFTLINLHNPGEKEVLARMKVATTKPNGEPGNASPFLSMKLGADQALGVDCSQTRKLANSTTGFLEGFVVVESDFSLDAVAVYTAGHDGKLETFEIERVPVRKQR